MRSSITIPRFVVGLFLALLACCSYSLCSSVTPSTQGRLHAQEPAAPLPEKHFEFEGLTSCAGCHEKPNVIYDRIGATKFVKLTESDIWLNHDKHSKAVELIDPKTSPLGKQMCDKLKIADIHQAKECLSCHANWQYDAQRKMWDERPKFHEFGVSCESCHGPASAWKGPHEKPEWRKLTPAAKLDMGMIEVRNPVARAKQCLACHVGDPAQQKVVTHEMYAAGHPPLPGVELETFASVMPPHWRHIDEKPDFDLRKEFIEANPSATAGDEFHASRSALISAVVAMQASLQLIAPQVEDARHLPDFAAFDCYACHHDLKTPAWRQQRKDVGVPGRPRPAVWPTTLIEAAYAMADGNPNSYRAAFKEYNAAFDAQPFGHTAKLAAARATLEGELAVLLPKLEQAKIDKAAVQRAVTSLTAPPAYLTLDYDAARQTAWALTVFAQDLALDLPTNFGTDLHLALPAGQAKSITQDLPARIKANSNYDPHSFRAQLKTIAAP